MYMMLDDIRIMEKNKAWKWGGIKYICIYNVCILHEYTYTHNLHLILSLTHTHLLLKAKQANLQHTHSTLRKTWVHRLH